MAQSTINCSKSTYIRPNDNTTHLGSSIKTSGLIGNNYDANQVYTAVLQFSIPSALRYKRFVSAKLNCYIRPSTSSGFGKGCWVAPYVCGDVLGSLVYANKDSNGIAGDSIEVERLDASATPSAQWRAFDVSSVFAANIYNNASYTILVNAAPGLPFMGSEATIDGAGSSHIPYLTVTYEDVTQLPPTLSYPSGVSLNENEAILFSWSFNSSTIATQASATLEYKLSSASTYTVVNLTQTGYTYLLSGGLPQGAYDWRVKVTNDAGEASDYSAVAHFNVIGKPAAPVIETPNNKCLTEIKWNADDQNAYEIVLSDANGNQIIDEFISSSVSSYNPNMFLRGNYTVGIRVKNSTGLYSDFAYKAFSISGSAPAKPTMSLRADGPRVIIDFTKANNVSYAIMRAEAGGAPECIGIVNTIQGSYTDDTVKSDVEYTYMLRAYTNGYTDSDKRSVCISFDGMILKSGGYELHLRMSEQEYLQYDETVNHVTSVLNFSGREYPLIERGEFTTLQIDRQFFVTEIEKKVLTEMLKLNGAYYRDTFGNAFDCALINVTFRAFKGIGYIAQITLVRTEKQEVMLNV